jgi:DNA-binding CsgD family transcriptional regulator
MARGAVGVARAGTLLERERELAFLESAVSAAAAGQGRAVLIEGAAGLGKSSLLNAARAGADASGLLVCEASGTELEREYAFGVVRQLFEAPLRALDEPTRSGLFEGAAALAAPLLGFEAARPVEPSFAALHGLHWLLVDLAARGPLMISVDDAHWADTPSLRWLSYLHNRLRDLPVVVVLAARPIPADIAASPLHELQARAGVQTLSPLPLSESSTAEVIRQTFATEADAEFVRACQRATRGNPFSLRELLRELDGDDVAPSAEAAATVGDRPPANLSRSVGVRLGRLGRVPTMLARAVAVLGDGIELRLAAELTDLDSRSAAAAADALIAESILAPGRPLRFEHPLIRAAVYEALPEGIRSRLHRAAVDLLEREGADAEVIAAQALACEPEADEKLVAHLRRAAPAALVRAAPAGAITYLRRALLEPPPEAARPDLLRELGRAETLARDPAAIEHLEEALALAGDEVLRAHLLYDLANVVLYAGDWNRAVELMHEAYRGLERVDPSAALHVQSTLTAVAGLDPRSAGRIREQFSSLREMAREGGRAGRALLLSLSLIKAVHAGRPEEVVELVERGLDGGRFVAEEGSDALAAAQAENALIFVDELERARELAEAMLRDAAERASVMGFVAGSAHRGMAALRQGRLTEAEADLRGAAELAVAHSLDFTLPFTGSYLATTLIERGRIDEAAAVIAPVDLALAGGNAPAIHTLLTTRARLRWLRDDPEGAIADLRATGETAEAAGLRSPNVCPWRSQLALVLARREPDEAAALARAELEIAHEAGVARGIGVALRACALTTQGDSVELLRDAVSALEGSPATLEHVRALIDLGSALRRAGHPSDARDPLRRALDIAYRHGAVLLARDAQSELRASGARPRRPHLSGVEALTPSEFRAARLAARGMSNRAIAEALFVTTKTVKDHLGGAYRTLDISGRAELAEALGGPAQSTGAD